MLPLAALAPCRCRRCFPGLASSGLHSQAGAFKLHLALAMIAYSLFVIALLHATLMAVAERQLHRKAGLAFSHLPPLLTLERLLFRMIGAAFVFLTLTLATGIAFSETLFGRAAARRPQDGVRRPVLAHLRLAARRALALRLARPHRGALDARRLRAAGARLRRQPLRARSASCSAR